MYTPHAHTWFTRHEHLSQAWKSTHLESYNCRHNRDDRITIGTESYHSLMYRIAKRICLDSVVSCSVIVGDSDVGYYCRISHWIRDYSGTESVKSFSHLARSGHNLDSIGNKTAMQNFSPRSCPVSTGLRPDTIQTTQVIVTVLTRDNRICHDIVTIVTRLHTIGWVSRMLRDTPNCRDWSAHIGGLFAINTDSVTNVYDCIQTMIGHSRSWRIVIRLFQFSCRNAFGSQTGAIIGNV